MPKKDDVGCPECASTTTWKTIENVMAASKLNFLILDESGALQVEYEGSTEYSNEATITALQCRNCGYTITGDMDAWADQLFPKPDLEALLALRDRLAPK